MNPASASVPPQAVRGVASGMMFMAFFGTLWAGIGILGLHGWGGIWLVIVAVLIGIGLAIGGGVLLRGSRRLPQQGASMSAQAGNRTNLWFGLIFAAEGILIGATSVLCNLINRFDLFFPITIMIVGAHFLPLAALFQLKPYYAVGILLCLLGCMTLLVVPPQATLGGQSIQAQWVVLGFGAACILWGVGLGLWMLGTRLLSRAESPKTPV